jgi:glycosyltransferase involved in cell wall biosynthesis
MAKKRVFIMGGDRGGWALDTEARLARACLELVPGLELVDSLVQADIVHTVWPEQLIEDPACEAVLKGGRPVVASFSNDPWALFERVPGLYSFARGWQCVAQSRKALHELKAMGIAGAMEVAYVADFSRFPPRERDVARAKATRRELGISEDVFLISSFQRDTEGADLSKPKTQKGPDIFCALVLEAQKRLGAGKLQVLLGGPRRHWLRRALREAGVPIAFLGQETAGDDYPWQNLPLERVAELLNASDLNLVTSRWEGAPRALLECAALGVPVLSTSEGIAEDLLEPGSIFRSLPEGVQKLVDAAEKRSLLCTTVPQRERLARNHSVEAVSAQWGKIYSTLNVVPHAKSSFLRDYPVHHPRFHRWLRRARLLKIMLKEVRHPPGEIAAELTTFPTLRDWRQAAREGRYPLFPAVIRPEQIIAKTELGSTGAVLCESGEGRPADEVLAATLGAMWPGEKFLPATGAELTGAKLLATCAASSAFATEALRNRVPVAFEENEGLRELAGFGGVEAPRGAIAVAVGNALGLVSSLRSCIWLPTAEENRALLEKHIRFVERRLFA